MTGRIHRSIECDGPALGAKGCPWQDGGIVDPAYEGDDLLVGYRIRARRDGWHCVAGRDLCPSCRRELLTARQQAH